LLGTDFVNTPAFPGFLGVSFVRSIDSNVLFIIPKWFGTRPVIGREIRLSREIGDPTNPHNLRLAFSLA
jgi:hypothetical protein